MITQVGDVIKILGRRYYITSCDPATRTYLRSLGLHIPPDLSDPSLTAFQDFLPASTPAAGVGKLKFSSDWPKQHSLATFVNKAGQVLRFFGEWVDYDKNLGGLTTPVTEKVELRYYLEDDTAEVRVHHLTPHQDALTPEKPQLPTKFLKRGPVAKELSELNGAASLGAVGRPTLNLVGLQGVGAHLKDRRPQALPSPSFLKPSELLLGNTVSVGGRLLRLCDCDSFTTIYYKNLLDIGTFVG
ncbi:EF-hand domain-containing family member C2-like [Palaemon carinicauda]|uniref:EF-hand domain-containing family member C2-like n=1 Tax=Palaemon carinicauda TaxID=392227 RepID=UPI0035B65129